MKMTLSMRFLLEQLTRLESLGFTRDDALRAIDMTEEATHDPLERVPLSRLLQIFQQAEAQLDDPNIGLKLGFKFRVTTYTKTGSIYSYCSNVPQVITTNAKYQRLAIHAGEIDYQQSLDSNTGQIRHFMTFHPFMEDVNAYRHVIDSIAGAYCTAYRWLSWSSGQDILQVELPYAAPEDISEHQEMFRCPMTFDQPYLRFEFAEKTMVAKIASSDPEKFTRAEARLMALIDGDDLCGGLKVAVKWAMRGCLENNQMGTHVVAKRMGKTWSVLRRQLMDAGLSYRDLLEKIRQEMFHECLDRGRTFSEIAQDLGYNDQAAFTKAFKRWYGVSPRQWKAAYQIAKTGRTDYTTVH